MIMKRCNTFSLPNFLGICFLLFGLVLVGCDSTGSGSGGETSTTAGVTDAANAQAGARVVVLTSAFLSAS